MFIFESGTPRTKDVETQKAIRSRAMKDFRRRQRAEIKPGQKLCTLRGKQLRAERKSALTVRRLLPKEDQDVSSSSTEDAPYLTSTPSPCQIPEPVVKTESDKHLHQQSCTGDEEDEEEVVDSLVVTTTSPPLLSPISRFRSAASQRAQLQYQFLTSYYSDSLISLNRDFINDYIWCGPKSRLLDASRSALNLIHLGTKFQDERLLNEGAKTHLVAVRLIREEIEKPYAVMDDALLGACYILAHCQIYQVMSQSGTNMSWQMHMDGLHYLLRKRGPKSINSQFARAIFHCVRQIGVMDHLLKRKTSFLSSPDWLIEASGPTNAAEQLTNIAFKISAALERAQRFSKTPESLEAYARKAELYCLRTDSALEQDMIELEQQLHEWLVAYLISSGISDAPFELVNTSAYPLFEEQGEALSQFTEDVYEFQSLISATVQIYIWILRLAIRMSQLELVSLRTTDPIESNAPIISRGDECALDLCRSLAYLSSPQHCSAGLLACSGPLYWASAWYDLRGDIARRDACFEFRDALERNSTTPLNLRNPVLTWWMLPTKLNG